IRRGSSGRMARTDGPVDLYTARFEQPREQGRSVFGGFLDREQKLTWFRAAREGAAQADRAGARFARDRKLFFAAGSARADSILDHVEIQRRLQREHREIALLPARTHFQRKAVVVDGDG